MDNRALMFWSAAGLAAAATILSVFLIRIKDMKQPASVDNKQKQAKGRVEAESAAETKKPVFVFSPAKKPDNNS